MKNLKTAIISLTFLIFSFTPLLAIEYSGIGGVPAYPREDNPRSESIFVYDNAPGSVVKDGIVVINNTNEVKTILVYATDTTPSSGGGFACKQFAEEVTDEGTWFKLTKDEVTLEPNTNEIVDFTLTIPENVTSGEHNACIVVQEKKEEDTDAGINLNFRAAIRAMLVVPGDLIRELSIKSFTYLKTDNEKNMLNLILTNSGNVSLDTNINIEVKNFLTQSIFLSNQSQYSILHSNDQEFNFDLDNNPWGGIYKANVDVSYVADDGERILTDELIFLIVPSIYVLGLYSVILILIFTGIFLIFDSKVRIRKAIADSSEYIVQEGDTIKSIAQDHNVKWKLIARLNHKKVPYEVTKGERLLVPSLGKKKSDTPTTPVQPSTPQSPQPPVNIPPVNS